MSKFLHWVVPVIALMSSSCALAQDNPLTTVLNEKKLSSAPFVYQGRVQPGALVVIDAAAQPQYPDPVPLLGSLKVLNEQPHLSHASIGVAKSKNFFLSLLSFDPSAKLGSGSVLEVDETDFVSTSITDGQMEKLVYHDPDFKASATEVLDNGGIAYLVESVWMATTLHVTQASSSQFAVSLGKALPDCSATIPVTNLPPQSTSNPVSNAGNAPTQGGGASGGSTHSGMNPTNSGSGAAPVSGGVSTSVQEGTQTLQHTIQTQVKALSNAVVNAVDEGSKLIATKAIPIQVGFSSCKNSNSIVELHSDRPIPVAVKLQRIIRNTNKPNGLGRVHAISALRR